jgi:preprotein translocase subunit SecE
MQRTKWHSREGGVQSMLIVIWALVIFTGVLAAAMGFYEYTAYKPNKSFEEQTKAVGKLTEAILWPSSIEEHLKLPKKITEEKERERIRTQQRPLTSKGKEG